MNDSPSPVYKDCDEKDNYKDNGVRQKRKYHENGEIQQKRKGEQEFKRFIGSNVKRHSSIQRDMPLSDFVMNLDPTNNTKDI